MPTRSQLVTANNFAKAKELAAWKAEVAEHWNEIEVVAVNYDDATFLQGFEVGKTVNATVVIDKHKLQGDLGLEFVKLRTDPTTNVDTVSIHAGELVKTEGTKLTFNIQIKASKAGTIKYGVRIYPNNPDIPHRQDFAYVKWINL